jgi:uncharacterized protein (TIGR00299 family) protein
MTGEQPERTYFEIDALLAEAELPPRTAELARRIFRRLGEAEAAVHGVGLDAVHFHEVGGLDALVDVVGTAACLDYLGADVVVSPLPLGRGFVSCRHGVLPLPAPATLGCLLGVPTYDAGIEAELVTPTGAAVAASIALRFERWPSLSPERIGWGAGTRSLPDRPNALRVVLGSASAGQGTREVAGNTFVLLESNLDDMTGELAGHVIGQLLQAGALDVWATPIQMKKGRPAVTLSVLAPAARAEELASHLFRETPTLGVRRSELTRFERPRRIIQVDTRFGSVPVKVAEGPYPPHYKPEFDRCAALAEAHGVPVREVLAEALAAARAKLEA